MRYIEHRNNKMIPGNLLSLLLTAAVFIIVVSTASAATFTNSAAIVPVDRVSNNAGTNPGLPPLYPSLINVTGLTGNITKVTVTFEMTSTWPDDIDLLLVHPDGTTKTLLISDAGGQGNVTNRTYTIDQAAAAGFPDTSTDAAPVPAGSYQPVNFAGLVTPEPGGQDNFPSAGGLQSFPAPTLNVFNGLAANGDWKLYLVDDQVVDTTSFPNGWSISIDTDGGGGGGLPAPVDFDGDGKTDWSVIRNTGAGPGGATTWYTQYNGAAGSQIDAWGLATDFFLPADFDGDGKADVAIWRQGGPGSAGFYILQSDGGTLRSEAFGQTGDDPTVIGDYDGDGDTDIALYRAGATAGDQSFWYFRLTTGGSDSVFAWGLNGDFPAPGDYDGDGSADFSIQRDVGGGQARFFTQTAAGVYTTTAFGAPSDVIVPGDYDGDGKTDYAVARDVSGQIYWYVLPSGGGAMTATPWGSAGLDFTVQGDYDGDGKTDVAIWRQNADPTQNFYYVLGSTSGFQFFEWGQLGDYPVASYNTH